MARKIQGHQLKGENLGDLLRSLRTEAGMTQADLGDATGYSRTSITNIEQGRQNVTLEALILLTRVLGYNMRIELVRAGE
jgi:transcriptional regulator with XRE-family HTH domain